MTDIGPLIAEVVRRRGLGGVGVAIVRQDEQPVFECVGLADRTTSDPIAPDGVFRIASISKTMTAIGLMQLRDEGLLDLDDPVNDYLKRLTVEPPPGSPAVTFRHLLTHTSGIGEMPRLADTVRREVWGLGRPGTTAADLATVYRGTIRTEVAAGSKWAYANHGFVVLGQLVEDISGEPFSEHMRRRLFDPLGMASTEYLRTERTAGDVATGYHWLFGRYRSVRDYDLSILGAGAVLSSLTDMATYAAWLAYGAAGTPSDVLAPGTLEEMMAPQYAIDPRLSGLGLAFFLGRIGEHPVVGHDGNIPGFASTLLVAPEEKLGVVVLTNTATLLGAGQLGAMVMRSLLGVADPMAGRQGAGVLERPHLWGDLVGYYAPRPGFLTNLRAWQMLGGEVQVVIRQRHLTITALSPVGQLRRGLRLQAADHADPLRFSFEYDGQLVQIAFGRGDNGQVDRVAIGRPVSVMLHRRPTWRSSGLRLRLFAAAGLVALRRARLRRSARRGRR